MYVYVTTARARDWWVRAMLEATSYLPTVFIDREAPYLAGVRKSWRIQNAQLGADWLADALRRAPKYARTPALDAQA